MSDISIAQAKALDAFFSNLEREVKEREARILDIPSKLPAFKRYTMDEYAAIYDREHIEVPSIASRVVLPIAIKARMSRAFEL